jgi:hypothetical protein
LFFSTGGPDGLMAMASRPSSPGKPEIEAADDFVAPSVPISSTSSQLADTVINQASFTGLIPLHQSLGGVRSVTIEIYGVFPAASNAARTPNVPTRANSPSDIALESFSSSGHELTFTTQVLSKDFTAANSVVNGINPSPNQTTMGEGPVSGKEVQFNVTFPEPLDLPAGHYFFVPQVQLGNGTFLWLSAPRPFSTADGATGFPPGTPPGTTDLQAWIRNQALQPDWLRVGTDIVGGNPAPTFNASFSLSGQEALQPHLTSISPNSSGPKRFQNLTLNVFGSNFTSLSQVVFNADTLKTTFISDTQLQAQVPASDLVAGKTASISVTNPSEGHPPIFADNTETFTVT